MQEAHQQITANEDAFLDEKQILTLIPISRRTLFNWRESGKIPHVKIGRRNLFHWPAVREALLRLQRGGVLA
jgi:predicted DNA-binding transcriptional regulator AlpA